MLGQWIQKTKSRTSIIFLHGFIGRWQVEQSLGMAKNATFIDYFENGSFSGEVINHDRIHNIDQNYDAVRTLR